MFSTLQLRAAASLLACALAVTGCRQQSTPTPPPPAASGPATNSGTPVVINGVPATAYPVRGVIEAVHTNKQQATIKHDEIPGYMVAMTMDFDVKEARELDGLKPGNIVKFRMLVTEKEGWIDQVVKVGEAPLPDPVPSVRRVRYVEPLNIGDALPDYTFTNELGQAVSLSSFKGRGLAFTFIFTRCPFPNFCPRMSDHFATAITNLLAAPDAPTNWHFLSISFDPSFDTPKTLAAYAKRYQADPARWNFVTGAIIDIDAITEQFGLYFAREGGTINHNLRTVVVDSLGRVQHVFTGNEWTAEALATEMRRAAGAK
jgi:protein SCO1/2